MSQVSLHGANYTFGYIYKHNTLGYHCYIQQKQISLHGANNNYCPHDYLNVKRLNDIFSHKEEMNSDKRL